jgi:hypothetical protein
MIKTRISVTLRSLPRQQDEEVEMLFFKIINEFFYLIGQLRLRSA